MFYFEENEKKMRCQIFHFLFSFRPQIFIFEKTTIFLTYSESEGPGLSHEIFFSKSEWGHFIICPFEDFLILKQVQNTKFLNFQKTGTFSKIRLKMIIMCEI